MDPGQLRVPRAKTFPDLVLHPLGHFQLAQNQQDPTRKNLIPQDTGRQEINFDFSDLVYEYPDYEDEGEEYYFLDDDKEKDYSNIEVERKPVTFKADNFRWLFFRKIYIKALVSEHQKRFLSSLQIQTQSFSYHSSRKVLILTKNPVS